jgi:hypothetical protein
MYLMLGTRPDLAFSISILSRYMKEPRMAHWKAVKRVFHYLKGTIHYGLVYSVPEGANARLLLETFSDSSHANNADLTSQCGYAVVCSGAAISWKSIKQPKVSGSTTESEYKAIWYACQEQIWLVNLMKELGVQNALGRVNLYCDNSGVVKYSRNAKSGGRLRHIALDYALVKQTAKDPNHRIVFCPTERMKADLLTKPLDKHLFEVHRYGLGLRDLNVPDISVYRLTELIDTEFISEIDFQDDLYFEQDLTEALLAEGVTSSEGVKLDCSTLQTRSAGDVNTEHHS